MNDSLIDKHGREIKYLRLSVTDRCNLRCVYCMPKKGIKLLERSEILSFSEILRIVGIFAKLKIKKVRLTGGEPLVREDIDNLVKSLIAANPDIDYGITTNGTLLDRHYKKFADYGLKKINISLDTINAARYSGITRNNTYTPQMILNYIDKAIEYGLKDIRINSVVSDFDDKEDIKNLISLAINKQIRVRFIEAMSTNNLPGRDIECGRTNYSYGRASLTDASTGYTFKQNIIDILNEFGNVNKVNTLNELGPASYYSINGKDGLIGIISNGASYCNSCNRLRLTSDGRLKLCLYSKNSLNLKKLLRSDCSDLKISQVIKKYIMNKPGNKFTCNGSKKILLPEYMNRVGG
ncbi:MAG: GTP 3',8-cyclase MoaA [Actinomycetota bacterium]|nr:GTP 3',8-cyclase MoaA [Actinomycetota bacterium]